MRSLTLFVLLAMTVAACTAPPNAPSAAPAWTAADLSGFRFKAVLAAGDRSAAAFDHATEAMRERLLAAHSAPADIQRLSAAPAEIAQDGVHSSSLGHVLAAIENMHPAPGEGCLVFATSHGAYHRGLVLMPSENFLTAVELDNALVKGCGNAPTVVVISGCFSGPFAKVPMARPNRIVLTAAREDRPSFGCGAEFEYTVYDRCLLQAMDQATGWRAVYAMIQACVSAREAELDERPSEPQAWFGEAVRGMPVPRGS
jgi:hypothetical protein